MFGLAYIGYLTIKVVHPETICELFHVDCVDHPLIVGARFMARIIADT